MARQCMCWLLATILSFVFGSIGSIEQGESFFITFFALSLLVVIFDRIILKKDVEEYQGGYGIVLQEGDKEGLAKTTQLYQEYLEAKKVYDNYQSSLNQARNGYASAQENYQNSIVQVQKLEQEIGSK